MPTRVPVECQGFFGVVASMAGRFSAWVVVLALVAGLVPQGLAQSSNTIVRFEVIRGTNALGVVDVEMFDQEKPATVRNFLLYVRSGAFSNSFLHRDVPGFIVQGGGFTVTDPSSTNAPTATNSPTATNQFAAYKAVTDFGKLTNEFLVGSRMSNTFGTIAMAKLGDDPNSASSQWFFNLGNNTTNLDNQNGGFTVFGRVMASTNATDGTNVLAHFNALSTTSTIVNLATLVSNSFGAFTDLPVASSNTPPRIPTYTGLYYTRISILNDSYVPGTNAPTVAITSPDSYTQFTNQVVTITGTASDDSEVARVTYRVTTVVNETNIVSAEQIATGTTNWTIRLAPSLGRTVVSVVSIDFDGLRSATNSVLFYYTAWVPLNLQVLGDGRVTGVTNGQRVELGRDYVAVAKPGKKQILETWSGSVTSRASTLAFLVPTNATNFSLTAQFAEDPFIRLAGTYHGIIRSNTPALENSGLVTLSLSKKGGVSGRIRHRTERMPSPANSTRITRQRCRETSAASTAPSR